MIRTLRTAARERIERLSRRDMLMLAGSAIAMKAADVAFDRLVVDAAVDAAAAPVDPVPHLRMDLGLAAFDRLASTAQRAAWEGLNLNDSIPDSAADRCSEIVERDGDMWVISQGGEVARILWGRPVLGRMADRPDRTFGRWRAECIRGAARRAEPTFELIRAVVDGRAHRYTALVVPGRTIRIVTARDEATPSPVRESTAPTTHPGFG